MFKLKPTDYYIMLHHLEADGNITDTCHWDMFKHLIKTEQEELYWDILHFELLKKKIGIKLNTLSSDNKE